MYLIPIGHTTWLFLTLIFIILCQMSTWVSRLPWNFSGIYKLKITWKGGDTDIFWNIVVPEGIFGGVPCGAYYIGDEFTFICISFFPVLIVGIYIVEYFLFSRDNGLFCILTGKYIAVLMSSIYLCRGLPPKYYHWVKKICIIFLLNTMNRKLW